MVILKLQSEFATACKRDAVELYFISTVDNVSASRTRILLLFYLQLRHATTAAVFWLGRIIRVGPSPF